MQKADKKPMSLQLKTTLVVVFAFAAASVTFYFFNFCFGKVIESAYLSQEKCKMRAERYLNEFRLYVQSNNISVNDTASVKKWCGEKKYVYISVYDGSKLCYETDGQFTEVYNDGGYTSANDYPTVRFAEGEYQVSVIEFSESILYDASTWVSLSAAVLMLLYLVLHFTGHLVRRIKLLSDELKSVCGSDFTKKITDDGNDELSSLAKNANEMRESIIAHYENEQKAWQANKELMTSLSHDIRTPLTSLLLYSDAIADGNVTDIEEARKYMKICGEKAHQLKDLTDAMFRYFLVFSKSKDNVNIEEYKASELLQQMIGEGIFYLSQKGFVINTVEMEKEVIIRTDAAVLKRVFDNVFSNVEKYADKSRSVNVSLSCNDERIRISVINGISKSISRAESTKIGLKSSEKIMSLLGGKFEYGSQNNLFEALIILPVAH